jgi:phage/plasmid-associated DNA primase
MVNVFLDILFRNTLLTSIKKLEHKFKEGETVVKSKGHQVFKELQLKCKPILIRESDKFNTLCPVHNDKEMSLSVAEGRIKVIFHCHACSAPEEQIAKAFGYEKNELFYPTRISKYPDGHTVTKYSDGRVRQQKGRKTNLFYNDPLIDARPTEPIYWVEGEKDAEIATTEAGLIGITVPGGGKNQNKADFSRLKGREVFVCIDNDTTGLTMGKTLLKGLVGEALEVVVLKPKDEYGKKADFADVYYNLGVNWRDGFEDITQELKDEIEEIERQEKENTPGNILDPYFFYFEVEKANLYALRPGLIPKAASIFAEHYTIVRYNGKARVGVDKNDIVVKRGETPYAWRNQKTRDISYFIDQEGAIPMPENRIDSLEAQFDKYCALRKEWVIDKKPTKFVLGDQTCVEGGEIVPYNGEFTMANTEFIPNPKRAKELSEKILNMVGDREDAYKALMFMFASVFDLEHSLGKEIFLIGAGANGKSTILQCFRGLLNEDNVTGVQNEIFSDRGSKTSLVALNSSVCNLLTEGSRVATHDNSIKRSAVSGEPFNARLIYDRRDTKVITRTTFMVACNDLPQLINPTYGDTRRRYIINFPNTYKEDREVSEWFQEKETLEALLYLIIEHLPEYLNGKRVLPESPAMEVDKLEHEMLDNIYIRFLYEYTSKHGPIEFRKPIADLYTDFTDWLVGEDENLNRNMSKQKFGYEFKHYLTNRDFNNRKAYVGPKPAYQKIIDVVLLEKSKEIIEEETINEEPFSDLQNNDKEPTLNEKTQKAINIRREKKKENEKQSFSLTYSKPNGSKPKELNDSELTLLDNIKAKQGSKINETDNDTG